MKKIIFMTAAFFFSVTVAMATTGPDVVTLENKKGDVTFDHAGHSQKMDCATCHEGEPAKIELNMKTGHALCKDCHKTQGAGPTKCGECHVK